MDTNAVEIRRLEKAFPKFTLGPIDLTVPVGLIYGFVGPNGAGKTTTLDLIFGLGAKSSGAIRVLGLDHARDEVAMKRQVGYFSPDLTFQPWGRVDKAARFVRSFYPTWDAEYAERLRGLFHLNWNDRIHTLSFGAKTKLSLLLTLAWRPTLIVLDEPTIGLDAISKQQIFGELLDAVRDGDRSVLISSHSLMDLERLADHVGMIKNGKMVFEGATRDVVERYCLVDVLTSGTIDLQARPGVVVQENSGNRWRLLLDRRVTSIEALSGLGLTLLSNAPMTLEDLFVALGKD